MKQNLVIAKQQNLVIAKHPCCKISSFCNVSKIIPRRLGNVAKDPHSFYDVGKISHNQSCSATFVRHHERYLFHNVSETRSINLRFTMFEKYHKRFLFHDVGETSLNQTTFCDV